MKLRGKVMFGWQVGYCGKGRFCSKGGVHGKRESMRAVGTVKRGQKIIGTK